MTNIINCMTSKDQAYTQVEKLLLRFDEQFPSYKRIEYNETLTRRDFIDPFFKALGWDIDNSNDYAEAYREVIHEDKVRISGATKAPDYSFRLSGGKRLFFVEAKRPSVAVKDDMIPAYQIRRYGWSAKLPISIVTDFEEFAVYDCTKKPNTNDKASVARIKYLNYKDYLKEFDFLWNTFSKERVLKGSFDKFIETDTYKKGSATVDQDFLGSLDRWRTLIAIDICKNNKLLGEDEINFAVQQFIDRLIFLRIAEDRSVEPYGRLKESINIGSQKNEAENASYSNLFQVFRQADDKYNSGLFDFRKDNISSSLVIDNKIIKTIVKEMYYPESPYEFSVLPVEILGSAYEQFLGKRIIVDSLHRAHIDEKPEVRKAGGVYYTPEYIVDYIVNNTVGKLVENKKPKEVSDIKILDPACGSGSFLLGAYRFLLDWHKDYYSENGKLKNKKIKQLTPEGNLTTAEKKRILLNNIYGVDIDFNAVEVTKLSLLLKCMEGETSSSIAHQLSFFNERILPTLDENIKSGNSLIDIDYYDNEINFEQEARLHPLNWQSAFPEIFIAGGFDAIIGNPPYGAELPKDHQRYLLKKFLIGSTDTAALFMMQAQKLIKDKGYNGFIVPKAFTFSSNYEKTRKEILKDLVLIIDCSKVWRQVKLEMTIYFTRKNSGTDEFISGTRIGTEIKTLGSISKSLCDEFNFILNGLSLEEIVAGRKIAESPLRLNDVVSNKRGAMLQAFIHDKGDLFVVGGKQIQPYNIEIDANRKINGQDVTDPNAGIKESAILVQNIVAHIQNPTPHILIIATLADKNSIENGVLLDTVNQLQNKSGLSSKFILGVLNSNIIAWYVYRFVYANAIRTMHFDSTSTQKIPFPSIDLNKKTDREKHDEVVKHVDTLLQQHEELKNAKLSTAIEQIRTRISYSKEKINNIVTQLFGFSSKSDYLLNN